MISEPVGMTLRVTQGEESPLDPMLNRCCAKFNRRPFPEHTNEPYGCREISTRSAVPSAPRYAFRVRNTSTSCGITQATSPNRSKVTMWGGATSAERHHQDGNERRQQQKAHGGKDQHGGETPSPRSSRAKANEAIPAQAIRSGKTHRG